ncbi:MAG: DUF2079 domain-containing protein [Bacteroidales bacterium]|nr:DUF2079 domain-containing protein [Bacteroidales bacterium]
MIIILFSGLYLAQVISNHYFFRTYAFDYALHNNAIWDFSHFRVNPNPIMTPPLKTFFQVHLSYTLIFILPLYWLLNPIAGTYTLLIIEVLFIILGGIGCYKFIKYLTNDYKLALLALFHYFILQGHFASLSSDYNDAIMGSAIITWFIYFFIKNKFVLSSLAFLFVLLSKENMSVWLVFVTVVLIIWQFKNRKARYFAGIYIVIAIAYFIIAMTVMIPYYEDPAFPYWGFHYRSFGETPKEVFKYFLAHPIEVFFKLFYNHNGHKLGNWVKAEYYYYFLICGGWLLFRRPVILLAILPMLAQKMLMDYPSRWSLGAYHSVEIESIYTLSVFYALSKIKNLESKYIIGLVITILCTHATIYGTGAERKYWHHEIKENVFSPKMYRSDLNIKEIRNALKMVPDDAGVCATNTITPHLAYRSKIYVFPEIRDAEYIVLLDDGNPYPLKMDRFEELKTDYLDSHEWETIYNKYQLTIFRKIP